MTVNLCMYWLFTQTFLDIMGSQDASRVLKLLHAAINYLKKLLKGLLALKFKRSSASCYEIG